MKIHTGFCLLLVLFASACTTINSPQYITYYLDRNYANRPVSEFFDAYGIPSGEFDTNGGGRIYRWSSVQPDARPAKANIHKQYTANGVYITNDTYRGTIERHYCELRIYANAEDNIQYFKIAVDSIGKWSASRCSEIFD